MADYQKVLSHDNNNADIDSDTDSRDEQTMNQQQRTTTIDHNAPSSTKLLEINHQSEVKNDLINDKEKESKSDEDNIIQIDGQLEETKEENTNPTKCSDVTEEEFTDEGLTPLKCDKKKRQTVCMILLEVSVGSKIEVNGKEREDVETYSVSFRYDKSKYKSDEDTPLMAYSRIVCYPDDISRIKTIRIKHEGFEEPVNISFQTIDTWIENSVDDVHDIEEQKYCQYDKEGNIRIYYEKIKNVLLRQSEKEVDREYLSVFDLREGYPDKWIRPFPFSRNVSANSYKPFPFPDWANRNDYRLWQIYYDKTRDIIYGLPTETALKSMGICGGGYLGGEQTTDFKTLSTCLNDVYAGSNTFKFGPQYYRNISYQSWLAGRYWWLTERCLYGQDNEFNIFRSLCFMQGFCVVGNNSYWFDYAIRLSVGILCLILQICLATGIVMEVIDNWDTENMFDNDSMIIIISFLVFSFISYTYIFTVIKYVEFYQNMMYVAEISWI
eukprot:276685_1